MDEELELGACKWLSEPICDVVNALDMVQEDGAVLDLFIDLVPIDVNILRFRGDFGVFGH